MKALKLLALTILAMTSFVVSATNLGECKESRSLSMTIVAEPEGHIYDGEEPALDEIKNTLYWCDGAYVAEGLAKFDYFLRDRSYTGGVEPVDPLLLDVLYEITKRLNYKGSIVVVSGYRTFASQNRLRASGDYAASLSSTHTYAQALDFYLEGFIELGRKADCQNCRQALYQTAFQVLEAHGMGGLGAYCGPSLHVDVRKGIPRAKGDKRSIVRRWGNQMNILEGSRNPSAQEFKLGMPMNCM